MNKKYDNNNIIIASRAYFLHDGCGEMYFRGGWSHFAKDHDLHQGFFMIFDYHCGTSKFDVKIYDCTQCQKRLRG
jgi:hypothetical protein